MNGALKLLAAVVFTFLVAAFSSASDIYIAQNAAGANTGADCADAFAASWFNSSANWGSNATQIRAGDTVHLCGTLTTALTAQASGTSGSHIAILFESGTRISLGACGSNGCLNIGGKSYITVDGGTNGIIEATDSGTGLGSAASYGVYARTCTGCEIKNLTIQNMYIHKAGSDNNGGNSYGIWIQGTNNLVHDNTIHDGMSGITVETGSSNNQFYNNIIYNVNWSIFESAGASVNAITNEKIYNNEFYDWANWDTTADTFHHDGVFLSGNNATNNLTHVDLYNNYLHGTSSSSVTCAPSPGNGSCMTAYIYINTDSNVRVFNNLLVANAGDPGPNNGWILMFSDANDSLYNNTIVGGGTTGPSSCVVLNSGTGFSFENNVMSNCPVLLWDNGSTFAASGLDANTYQRTSLTSAWRNGNNYFNALADWGASSGGDANAQALTGGLNLDSKYKPLSNSILVSAARNLTDLGIASLDTDKAGVARPGSNPWDAGAYQEASNNLPPNPPSGLAAQVN